MFSKSYNATAIQIIIDFIVLYESSFLNIVDGTETSPTYNQSLQLAFYTVACTTTTVVNVSG